MTTPESRRPGRGTADVSATATADDSEAVEAPEEQTGPRRGRRGRTVRRRGRFRLGLRGKALLVGGAVVVVAVVLLLVAYLSPLMAVRNIVVVGLGTVPENTVLGTLGIPQGEPLMQVDTAAAASRVAGIARVAQVEVQRQYPSTIRVVVTERVPVAYVSRPDGTHLLDGGGVDFATAPPPPGLPELKVPHPGAGDPVTRACLSVLTTMPDQLRAQVAAVSADRTDDITLTLRDHKVVEWGTADSSPRKAAVALALLTRPGHTYNVSSPALPTVK